ncbi:MAG TPA: amidohydrolase, partial [Bryobacteraceae bacterium]|nr:amidohydrolase [Bryobacteraceae bacterium]
MKIKKLCWAAVLGTATAAGVLGEVPSAIAIKDAHVVPVSGQDMPKATVLLRHGLIEDVGANVSIPPDAWVIDGTGLTVYPGFIDALSTWGIPPPPVAAGVAARAAAAPTAGAVTPTDSPRAAEAAGDPRVHGPEERPQTYAYERAADLVSPSDARLEAARAAGFTTSATFPNRGIVEGLGALIDLAGERGRDMVVAQPIGQQILFRVAGGGFGRTFPGSLMGNIAYVRQLYLDLDQYKEAKQRYAQHANGTPRPEYDHALEGLAEAPRILLPADQSQQIERI